ncbi:hypothetical protein [Haloarcula regularis]|nr:hypothetical protein [Halomicroarcula sp. SYNS111]
MALEFAVMSAVVLLLASFEVAAPLMPLLLVFVVALLRYGRKSFSGLY